MGSSGVRVSEQYFLESFLGKIARSPDDVDIRGRHKGGSNFISSYPRLCESSPPTMISLNS